MKFMICDLNVFSLRQKKKSQSAVSCYVGCFVKGCEASGNQLLRLSLKHSSAFILFVISEYICMTLEQVR